MNRTFIDTSYVIALVNRRDQYHEKALELSDSYENELLITTDAVLFEIGNALTKKYKKEYIEVIEHFLSSDEVQIIYSDAELFQKAFEYYKLYTDKTWTLVDCLSIYIMRKLKINAALTSDKHFEQAGLIALMK